MARVDVRLASGRSLPLLQPAAMRSATRQSLKGHHGLLNDLRTAVAKICAVEAPHEVQLERVSRRTIVMFASLALATYFLLPQFAETTTETRPDPIALVAWLFDRQHFIADQNMSVIEGSLGILPRRVLVADDRVDEARRILRDAGIGEELEKPKGKG